MARRRIATGIDIGTNYIKVVVVEDVGTERAPVAKIIGVGSAPSAGMRQGYVIDKDDAAHALLVAKRQAEAMARVPITTGFLAVGGISLDDTRSTGATVIARADQEITDLDMEKVVETSRHAVERQFLNKQVLHEIPLEFRIDGAKSLGDPLGFKGNRLEADYLFVSCLAQHVESLTDVAERADIDILDQMASPLAGSSVTLSKDQKMKGCVLANLGAETLSIVVYDENIPCSVKVFPFGSARITDELALQFKVSLEDAERIKTGKLAGAMYPKKKVDDIIGSQLKQAFDAVDKHLRTLGKRGTLPAGIILSGGGANSLITLETAKAVLALPSRLAELQVPADTKVKDPAWSIAYGVALWGLTGDTEVPKKNPFRGAGKSLQRFLQQFLP